MPQRQFIKVEEQGLMNLNWSTAQMLTIITLFMHILAKVVFGSSLDAHSATATAKKEEMLEGTWEHDTLHESMALARFFFFLFGNLKNYLL